MGSDHLRVLDGGRSEQVTGAIETSRLIDLDVEASVVGNALYQNDLFAELASFLRPEMFASEKYRRVFEAMLALHERGEPIDVVAVATELRKTGRLEQVDGIRGITELAQQGPVLILPHLLAHGRRVLDLATRRRTRDLGRLLTSRTEADAADTVAILTDARAALEDLTGALVATEGSSRADSVVDRALARIVDAADGTGRGRRPTGFDAIDVMTAGLPDELTIIAARPGMGKTSLASAFAVNVARRGGGVFIASLETSDTDLMTRIVCAQAGVDVQRALAGSMSREDFARFVLAAQEIRALPLFVEASRPTVRELRDKCRRLQLTLHREGKRLELVVVDYLQLVRPPRAGMKREAEVGEIARALSAMAQELRVAVVALAQVNRDCEKRPDKRPQLSDLRESGEIEQAARLVLSLYREDSHSKKRRDYRPTGLAEIAVLKQNNGPSGGIARLRFDGPSTRFSDLDGAAPGHSAECRCSACAPSSSLTPPELQT